MVKIFLLLICTIFLLSCNRKNDKQYTTTTEIENNQIIIAQDFSIFEITNNKIYSLDVEKLQTLLKNCGFDEIGKIDGYYGMLTENVIKTIQRFLGFEENGKVDRKLWDYIFSVENENILKNICTVSKYDRNNFTKTTVDNVDEIQSTEGNHIDRYFQNDEIKIGEIYIFGEIGKGEYYFYYIDLNNCFLLIKNYSYGDHLYSYLNKIPETGEYVFDEKKWKDELTMEYKTFIKMDNKHYQIIEGDIIEIDTYKNFFDIIENK